MTTYTKIGATDYLNADYSIPSERTFRDGWEVNENVIQVNMTKAKDIWREKIREARKEVLEDLDVQYMRALETGADTSQIIADKQTLRDAPALTSIDAATTPEELTAIQPIPNVIIK
tara:strand:- start:3122 stop:3472 length:351 start_codon:yes stop_codon:yes gene_type:complete